MTFAKRFDIKKAMQATTESIVEDLAGNDTPAGIDPESTNDLETPTAKVEVAQEGDTVDTLEASTPVPVEDATVVVTDVVETPVDAVVEGGGVPVEPAADVAPVELVEPIATDGDVAPLNTEVVVEPEVAVDADLTGDAPVVDHAAPTTAEDAVIVNGDVTINNAEPEHDDELAEIYEEEIEVGTEAIDLLGKLTTAIETSTEAKIGVETINAFSKVALESICASIKMPADSKAYPSLESITVDTVKDFAAKLTTSVESFKEKVAELKAPKK